MKLFNFAALTATLIAISISSPAMSAPLNRLELRGKAVLTRLCANCHAVGTTGKSPHVLAPTLRTIENRYAIDDLVDQLREGFTALHPDMPTYSFTPQDAEAARAYQKVIQE
jgi:mono/diheme cytochrome c family protein